MLSYLHKLKLSSTLEQKVERQSSRVIKSNNLQSIVINDHNIKKITNITYNILDIIKPQLITLDEKYDYTPDEFDNLYFTLFPFQCVTLKAMYDLEKEGKIQFLADDIQNVYTNCGILSNNVGTGKTLILLALIRIQPFLNRPVYTINYPCSEYKLLPLNSHSKRTFKYIKPISLIFVASSVFNQWIEAIENLTDFKYFTINDIYDLRKYVDMINDNTIDNYNIILVRNGISSSAAETPDSVENTTMQGSLNNYIANISIKFAYTRVIYDDFDILHNMLSEYFCTINSIFTWYISATVIKKVNNRKKQINELSIFQNINFKYNDNIYLTNQTLLRNNNILNTILNIQYNARLINDYLQLSKPNMYYYTIKNIDSKYNSFINILINDDVKNMSEMLNSGSIETAAKAADIDAKDANDLFEKLLRKKYEQLITAKKRLDFMDNINLNALPRSDNYIYGVEHLHSFVEPLYKTTYLKTLIETQHKKETDIKNSIESILSRLKERLADDCPICSEPISDILSADSNEIIILKCCFTIGCSNCILAGLQIRIENNDKLLGRCFNCRSEIDFKQSCTFIKNIDMNKFIEDVIEKKNRNEIYQDIKHDFSDKKLDISQNVVLKDINHKNDMLKLILQEIEDYKQIYIHPLELYNQDYKKQIPHKGFKKYLLFSYYGESLNIIKPVFDELKDIKLFNLIGTSSELNHTVKAFQKYQGKACLLINASTKCSGLNLQKEVSDIIFYHRLHNIEVEIQAIGRCQRIGRDSTLNIHYLFYEDE
jgi:hypothetical protein